MASRPHGPIRAVEVRDPLHADEREALLRAKRPRVALPMISKRRSLPLLAEARRSIAASDRATPSGRPRCAAIWRAGTAARAPARARPTSSTTAECLDLVAQMAALGVQEVTLIGGEAYLRDDWLDDRPRHPRRAACTAR